RLRARHRIGDDRLASQIAELIEQALDDWNISLGRLAAGDHIPIRRGALEREFAIAGFDLDGVDRFGIDLDDSLVAKIQRRLVEAAHRVLGDRVNRRALAAAHVDSALALPAL